MAIQPGIVEKMEPDSGKLFVGGISWDTDETRLREYFGSYGEVLEAVIMRDRVTGRARGFGFIVFGDPAVAERVVAEKHMIDGRTVEAKKAVPREDHRGSNGGGGGQPPPVGRTRKIFVGGLASTVTETNFRSYFDQFGPVSDVVVMYDHHTQRPRGFGFITYDSEESVDRVLHKTFHELNGKMVEVKRAIPKELSPGPRSPLVGYNYGLTRPSPLMSPVGGYGVRTDSRFSPIAGSRTGFSPFGSAGYGIGMNLEPALSPNAFGGTTNFTNNMGYGRVLSPFYANSNRYITPIGYNQGTARNEPFMGSSNRNLWGNGLTSPVGSGGFGVFGNGPNWGSSPIGPPGGGSPVGALRGLGGGETVYGLGGGGGLGRNNGGGGGGTAAFGALGGGHEGSYGNLYRGGSMYGDATWQGPSSELDGPGPFGYGLDNAEAVAGRGPDGYVGNFSIANRQTNRGIAT